jgi:hypothetical protein
MAQQGAQTHRPAAVTEQGPLPGRLQRDDPCLRQESGAQQLGQSGRIGLAVHQPRGGDRLAPQRVHQVGLER